MQLPRPHRPQSHPNQCVIITTLNRRPQVAAYTTIDGDTTLSELAHIEFPGSVVMVGQAITAWSQAEFAMAEYSEFIKHLAHEQNP